MFGQVGDDAVAGTDAEPLQARPGARDLLAEVAEGELLRRPRLRERDDGDRVEILVATDHVLGVVQARAGEPLRARHLAGPEHTLVRRVRADLEEVPDRSPEALEVGDRPLPQLVVAGEVETPLVAQPLEVAAEHEPLPGVSRRRPEHLALRQRSIHASAHESDPRLVERSSARCLAEATARRIGLRDTQAATRKGQPPDEGARGEGGDRDRVGAGNRTRDGRASLRARRARPRQRSRRRPGC